MCGCVVMYSMIALTPLPLYMITKLEKRITPTNLHKADFDGFIFLGGSFSLRETGIVRKPIYNLAGSRLFDFVLLAKEFPQKKILLTGTPIETKYGAEILIKHGIDPSRLILEEASRNTQDNAKLSLEKMGQNPNGQWVLVTSAFHMPRSLGLFRKVGWNIIPYPVGYHTTCQFEGWVSSSTWVHVHTRLNQAAWRVATTEFLGMTKNYMEGRSDTWFPRS